MKIKTILISLALMLIIPSLVFAQIQFSIHANYGISNFKEKNNEPAVVVANSYERLPSYSIGSEALHSFTNSRFGLSSGLFFSSFASENHMPDDFDYTSYSGPRKWEEKFYSLSLPIKVNYKFEEWLRLNAGLVNTVHLSKPNDLTTKKINTYTLNIIGGVDFVLMQRVIVGASYYRDIRPSMMLLQLPSESETYDIKYSIEQITIKLGYIFG